MERDGEEGGRRRRRSIEGKLRRPKKVIQWPLFTTKDTFYTYKNILIYVYILHIASKGRKGKERANGGRRGGPFIEHDRRETLIETYII